MEKRQSILRRLLIVSQTEFASSLTWGVVLVALLAGLLFLGYKAMFTVKPDYEGRIVDKWAGYSHSVEGSFPYFKLLVETDNGQKLTVTVDQGEYGRARIGMRIRKTQKGIELTRLGPTKLYEINLQLLVFLTASSNYQGQDGSAFPGSFSSRALTS